MENTKLSPILNDQPSQRDYLDFDSYTQALKDLIVYPSTTTPLTLGIFGRWGTGKTTLMRMLEKELKETGIITVWFNAWQYSKEDELWAAFLQSILNKIRFDLSIFQKIYFGLRLLWYRTDWGKVSEYGVQYLFRALVVISPLIIAWPLFQQFRQELYDSIIRIGAGVVSLGLGVWVFVKPLVATIRQNITIDFNTFRQTSNYQEHIAFLDRFREHFADIVHSLPSKSDKCLAVFIDDLDRCSSDSTLQVLDAIKLFVDIPGCIYIMGLDQDIVQRAVAIKYKDDFEAQREYLGKIIQLPFQIPPLSQDEMRNFVEQLELELPDMRCRDVFIVGLMANPREIKRTINIFSLLLNLSTKRQELIDAIKPVRLAKIVVIQHSYPELHKLLLSQPQLLSELERFIREEQDRKQTRGANNFQDSEEVSNVQRQPVDLFSFLPQILQPFARNEIIQSMLLLHKLERADRDDANFAYVSPKEIEVYFTLTRRVEEPSTEDKEIKWLFLSARYQVLREIGTGGVSTVYLAIDRLQKQHVAIKLLHPSASSSSKTVVRFQEEYKALSQFDHPNIVRVYDYKESDGQNFYVMEYLSKGTLQSILEKKVKLSTTETLKILIPILDALCYIHDFGYIHRDIKPSTIIFDERGVPKLTDLSIAHVPNLGITEERDIFGTIQYMSPEQIQGNKVDARTDLYSFGLVVYECLTGQGPIESRTLIEIFDRRTKESPLSPRKLNPNISPDLEQIILKLLEIDPSNRYATAEEVKEALLRTEEP